LHPLNVNTIEALKTTAKNLFPLFIIFSPH